MVNKVVTHSKAVLDIAISKGWLAGARYTNLRDVKSVRDVFFVDIDWKAYNFNRHLAAVKMIKPKMTVARDVENIAVLDSILLEAELLANFVDKVIVVPKDKRLEKVMESEVPKEFIFGYSVPTKYGGTPIRPKFFKRKVHLLGGRPDHQRALADKMDVWSLDCNRFTLDARFGDYFTGTRFIPHPVGGYKRCIEESIDSINRIWDDYNIDK